jgi:cytochrome c2
MISESRRRATRARARRGAGLLGQLTMLAFVGCRNHPSGTVTATGDAARGRTAIEHYSCGACHVINGIPNAHGRVGPMLIRFREQTMIAGQVPNSLENLVRWIRTPQTISPGTAMPNLGIDDPTARDIAAYLYTAR